MSLHALQCALAELFTDARSRESCARDPAAFARARNLGEREREQLEAMSAAAIGGYAAGLVRKRRSEAARLLPKTRAALGDGFDPAFTKWARERELPSGAARYPRDAAGFGRALLAKRDLENGTRAAIREDRAALRDALRPAWLSWPFHRLSAAIAAAALALAGCGAPGPAAPAAFASMSPARDPSFELPMRESALEWPVFAHDQFRSAFQPMDAGITQANVKHLKLHWVWKSGSPFYSSPIVVRGVVYAIDGEGILTSLDAATGTVKWQQRFASSAMDPAYDDGMLFVSTRFAGTNKPSVFYALDPSNGRVRWQRSIHGGTHGAPVFVNGMVYVATALGDKPLCDPGSIHVFDERTGAAGPVWFTQPGVQDDGGGVWGALSVTADRREILFGTGNTCYDSVAAANAINAMTPSATTIWSVNTADPLTDYDVAGGVLVLGNAGYVIGKNGTFYSVDLTTGKLLWSTQLNAYVSTGPGGGFATPTYTEGTLIVSGGFGGPKRTPKYYGGMLFGVSPAGKPVWEIDTNEPVAGGWVATTKDLAFAELDNSVAALDPPTGKILWSYATQGYFGAQASPVVTPEGVFASDRSGYLYNFTVPASGERNRTAALPIAYRDMPVPDSALPPVPWYCKLSSRL